MHKTIILLLLLAAQQVTAQKDPGNRVTVDPAIFCDVFTTIADSTDYFNCGNIDSVSVHFAENVNVYDTNSWTNKIELSWNHERVLLSYRFTNNAQRTFNQLKRELEYPRGELLSYVKSGAFFLILENTIEIVLFNGHHKDQYHQIKEELMKREYDGLLEINGKLIILK